MATRVNVLAVDDKPANLTALESVLGAEFNLVFAHSGPEAIAILKSGRDIDIILMDVQMPMLDGFETAARIKQIESAKDIPIVFITAVYQDDPWVKKGYAVGAVDYIAKPFEPDLLKLKVGVYATLKRKADFIRERELQLRITEELLAASRKLSSELEEVPLGVIIMNAEGRILQMGGETLRLLGATGGSAASGADAWVGVELLLQEELGDALRAVQQKNSEHREIVRIQSLDGSKRTVLCSISPLAPQHGGAPDMAVVIHDLTETNQIKGDFERRVARLVSEDLLPGGQVGR